MTHATAPDEPLTLAYRVNGAQPRLYVHSRAETISNFLRDYGVWQRDLLLFMLAYLREGDVFVDVGANIGYFSIYAGLRVGLSGQVHAIEPADENLTVLKANMALNGVSNIMVHGVAVSDHVGHAKLFSSTGNAGAHSLLHKSGLLPAATVPLTTLNHLLKRERTPKLIKIDVQGADFDVLRGMSGLLQSCETKPAIITEFCLLELAQRGHLDAFFNFLESYGYGVRAFIANERARITPPQLRKATLKRVAYDLVDAKDAAEFDVLLLPNPSP